MILTARVNLAKNEGLPWQHHNYELIRRRYAIQQPDSFIIVSKLQEKVGVQKSRQGGRVSLLGPLTITFCLALLSMPIGVERQHLPLVCPYF